MFRIASLALLCSTLLAQEATRLQIKPEELPPARTDWYGLYMLKAKVGWVRQAYGRTEGGELFMEYEVRLQMNGPGGEVRMSLVERREYDGKPPYALRSVKHVGDMGGGVTRISVVRGDGGYKASVRSGAESTDKTVEIDYTYADEIGATVWLLRGGLKPGSVLVSHDLDTEEFKVGTNTIKITAVQDTLVRGVRQRVYTGRMSSSRSGDLGVMRATGDGTMISIALGNSMEARREPESIAKKPGAVVDMFALSMVPVDKPLGAHGTIATLTLAASGEGAKHLKSGPRQTVADGIIKLGAAHGVKTPATAEETREALETTREYASKNERVIAMARGAVGDAASPRAKVNRLVPFVAKYIEDVYGPEYPTALEVIRAKRGDCSAHAMLFVALARAVGVPAREVSGYMYIGDQAKAFAGHVWCEVVLDGMWVEVDPTWNETDINATHISFRGKEADMDMLKVLGNLTLRVVEIQRR